MIDYAHRRQQGQGAPSRYDLRALRTDGSIVYIELSAAIITYHGRPVSLGFIRDITARRQTEETIEQERQRLSIILDGSPVPTFVVDCNRLVMLWNRACEDLTKIPKEKVIGRPVDSRIFYSGLHRPVLADLVLAMDEEAIMLLYGDKNVSRSSTIPWAFEASDELIIGGIKRNVYYQAAQLRDSQGNVIGVIETVQDVTERALLQRQLEQAQKMEAVGTLAGGVAHDFNNIIQAIKGYSQLLLMDKEESDREYEELRAIEEAATRAAELTQGLLTFSRKLESKLRPISLNDEVAQVVRLLKRTIPKTIKIELCLADDLKILNGDPAQIEQIIMNLAVNAKDAMPDGGTLAIGTQTVLLEEEVAKISPDMKAGEYVLLTVRDSGHGMAQETMEHIFEPFYTTKVVGQGTGLGLSVVYGIVKNHGGVITCHSAPGKGTSFDLYFPIIARQVSPVDQDQKDFPRGGRETILLVDDEEYIVGVTKSILNKFGYTVLTAANGLEAIHIYQRDLPDIALVILDLNMPEMGGKECLAKILKINHRAKVLIASGYSKHTDLDAVLRSGARTILNKPYNVSEMLETIRGILDAD
ncbi:MAG: response regulator [Deltaproteobacteria bacterium]|nr:response regulator [Deltaproteobacteria bacterium]